MVGKENFLSFFRSFALYNGWRSLLRPQLLDKCGTWTLAAASENNYTLVIYFCSYLYISFVNSEITLGNCIMPFYGHLPVKNSLFGFLLRSVGQ